MQKAYTKQFKEKIAKLSRDQVLEYYQNGQIAIDGVTIEKDWLKITKKFTEKYTKDPQFGVDCNFESSVMLDLQINDDLK